MAKSINQVILMGRLTRDVELRATSSGKNVAEFSLAVDGMNDKTDFFDVTAWDKTAEIMEKYTAKGSKVLVQGRLRQDNWEDKDGNKRSKVAITAFDVTFLDSKQGSQDGSQGQDVLPNDNAMDKPIDLAEIPF